MKWTNIIYILDASNFKTLLFKNFWKTFFRVEIRLYRMTSWATSSDEWNRADMILLIVINQVSEDLCIHSLIYIKYTNIVIRNFLSNIQFVDFYQLVQKTVANLKYFDCVVTQANCPVSWGCRIHWLHLCRGIRPPANECPWYDTKQSGGEFPTVLELWGM